MFTGLVEKMGQIREFVGNTDGAKLVVSATPPYEVGLGDSVAVNGCCLTVTGFGDGQMTFALSRETLEKTHFIKLLQTFKGGEAVNLERALRLGDRLGGHLVQGHVDGVCEVVARKDAGECTEFSCRLPAQMRPFVIPKGSLTLDGVSLTVNAITDEYEKGFLVRLMLIPHTLAVTTWGGLEVGDSLNFEADMFGKYAVQAAQLRK